MVYKPDYTLQVGGQDVHLLFTSYMYKKYCEKKGIELDDFLRIVQKAITPEKQRTDEWKEANKDVADFKTADYVDIFLAGHETWCVYNKQPFTATEADAWTWIDARGGIVGSANERIEIFRVFISKLLNIDLGAVETKEEVTEPKNGVAPAGVLPGENSLVSL